MIAPKWWGVITVVAVEVVLFVTTQVGHRLAAKTLKERNPDHENMHPTQVDWGPYRFVYWLDMLYILWHFPLIVPMCALSKNNTANGTVVVFGTVILYGGLILVFSR